MKTLALNGALAVGITGLASAQNNPPHPLLLEEHHDKIQALIDKNPTLSRQALSPQLHAISDETHHGIEALLTDHQKQLVKAIQKRMHDGEETRRPAAPR
jgi:hypothetical protein